MIALIQSPDIPNNPPIDGEENPREKVLSLEEKFPRGKISREKKSL